MTSFASTCEVPILPAVHPEIERPNGSKGFN